jgi:hypothetical protein
MSSFFSIYLGYQANCLSILDLYFLSECGISWEGDNRIACSRRC